MAITTILIGMMAVSCIMDDFETDSEAMLEIGFFLARLSQVVNLSPVSFRIPLLSRFIP